MTPNHKLRSDPGNALDPRLRSRLDLCDEIGELAARIATVMPQRLASMCHAMNDGVAAHKTDGDSPGGPARERDDTGAYQVDDPTGDAAVTPDTVWQEFQRIQREQRKAKRALDNVAHILSFYGTRSPSKKERRETSRFNDPGCGSCARLPSPSDPKTPRYEPPFSPRKTDLGVLNKQWLLCEFCRRWTIDTQRLPTVEELRQHHAGKYVRRPA